MYAISYTSIIIVMHTMRVVISEMNISQVKQIHAKKFIASCENSWQSFA